MDAAVDVSNGSAHDSVMVALLPTTIDWCSIDLPHLTLVYAGLKDDLNPTAFNEIAKDAAMLAMLTSELILPVMSKEVFGDDEKVDVFRLQATPELLAMRRAVESWNTSTYSFNPHVTVGPMGSFVEFPPRVLVFDRIMVGWGDEQLTFWLKK